MNLLDLAKHKIVVLDGATGTAIQAQKLPAAAFGEYEGCNEALVLTAPEAVTRVHEGYLTAGADVISTDTFGGAPHVLAEYNLADQTETINETAARLARLAADRATTPDRPRFVAGSIGPGTKLPTLGQIDYDSLYRGLRRQIEGLLAGSVDLLLVETVQDLLQAKAALAAARDAMRAGREVPLYVSVTVEQTGTLLTGSDIEAAIAVLEPFGVDVIGLNCATGPAAMRPHLETLARRWPGLIGVYPNAGLPVPCATGVCYPEQPAEFTATLRRFLADLPINFVGGCCGTTPDHIRVLADAVADLAPRPNRAQFEPCLASLFNAVSIRQEPAPLFVGERANATGSKAFRDAILANDHESAFDILAEQIDHGSHAADLSVAYAGQDEPHHMRAMMARAAKECRLPIFIDSNQTEAVEIALRLYPGRAVVNSINLEDGGKRAAEILPLVRRFGAGVIGLTIDEEGMAMTADRKVAIAHRLVDLCVREHGLRPADLFLDTLTFTVGSGDSSLRRAAIETLEAIRRIKREIPGAHTLLGLSNVSFGLSPKSRRVLNSVFLDMAVRAGLDAAILNPKQIVPLAQLANEDVEVATDLLLDRSHGEDHDPLSAFIQHFQGRADLDAAETPVDLPPAEAVHRGIVAGKTNAVLQNLPALLAERSAEAILNDLLVPAMKEVGDLFGAGKMQLPFVLKSAESMKRAVDTLRPHFASVTGDARPRKLLLATVRGDVHDIGKNLVDIIVANNGFEVVNLGIKVPVEVIEAEARRHAVDAIGMSGLLVSSAMIMAENLRAMTEAGMSLPVLVGGAALTPEFVRDALKPAYPNGTVIYCADAFAGLNAMRAIAAGDAPREPEIRVVTDLPRDSFPRAPLRIARVAPPAPPFLGSRVLPDIQLDSVLTYVNKIALYRGRWGYRRGNLPREEFQDIMRREVQPRYRELIRAAKAEKIMVPRGVYGYFRARPDGDAILVEHGGRELRFEFPRRRVEPHICIADFLHPDGDVVGLFVVTLGDGATRREGEVFGRSEFLDYFLLHGLAVEVTDALAEFVHEMMRHEWGIGEDRRLNWQEFVTQAYRGSRYGFGYPSCPDLSQHDHVWRLLDPARVEVSLTEGYQMVPEFSTAALVLHHPQAKYFYV